MSMSTVAGHQALSPAPIDATAPGENMGRLSWRLVAIGLAILGLMLAARSSSTTVQELLLDVVYSR